MNLTKTSSVALLLLLMLLFCSPAALAQDGTQLFIKTIPDDVTLSILNHPGGFQQGIKLKPGTYLVRASKQGYQAETKKVTLTDKAEFTLTIQLKPLAATAAEPTGEAPAEDQPQAQESADSGHLFVQADPSDAIIRILRIKPVFKQGIALDPGTYLVEVSKEGYSTKKREVTIQKGQDTKVEIALFLKSDMGKLYVNTDPMDAEVRLPHIKPKYEPGMELSPGDYTVEITKEGFKTVSTELKIEDGKIKRLNVTLKKLTEEDKAEAASEASQTPPEPLKKGTLAIQLSPADAEVRILDIDKPYTPGMELDTGFYVVEAQKEGFLTATSKVAIKPDQATTISISLAQKAEQAAAPAPEPAPEPAAEPAPEATPEEQQQTETPEQAQTQPQEQPETVEPGKERLFITPVPDDAQVRVLNIGPKYTQGMELGPGKYEVEVKKQGLGKKVETIEVEPGKDTHHTIDLTKGKEQQEPPAPETGTLRVETNLENPVITIDDKPGYNKESALAPGEYQVEVSGELPGTEETTAEHRSVIINAGETTSLNITVTPKPEAKPEPAAAPEQKPASEQKPAPEQQPEPTPQKQAEPPASSAAQQAPEKTPAPEHAPMTTDAESLRKSALEAMTQKDYAKALQLVRQALALSQPDATTYALMGDIYLLMKDNANALKAYDKTIELAPEMATAYAARGEVYVRLKDTESACYDFWKACALGKCKEIGLAKNNGICR